MIVGIDLGTTNSACSVWQDGQSQLIPNRLGESLTPSVVGIDTHHNVIVGQQAKNRLITQPAHTVGVFKRMMGTKHQVRLGAQYFSATELSAFVLRSLKEDAESFLDSPVEEAIISVPAYFNDNQRQATKHAGELAGLRVQRLINEPTAAALAYGLHERSDGVFAVLDMGGGTFDVSIIEYFEGVMEVHASAGDNFLGGEDFLAAMVASFLDQNALQKDALDPTETQRLFEVFEQVKRGLSSADYPKVEIELAGEKTRLDVTEEWFRQAVGPLLPRVRIPVEQALRDAGLRPESIDDVLLVGGATRMPVFRNLVGKLLRRIPSGYLDPDLVVAQGAAVQAGLKAKDQSLDEVVLTDVCPYTLGVEVVDPYGGRQAGHFLPILERNTVVPVSVVTTVATVEDKQDRVMVNIYQGEHRLVEKNIFLGSMDVPVPKNKAGHETLDIRFSYDMNGILEVDVVVNSTGKAMNHVIEQSPGGLGEKELSASKERLAKLKFHPREKEENLTLLSRGERLYAMSLGSDRERLGALLAEFEAILNRQNEMEIAKARRELSALLDRMEDGTLT